MMNSRRHKGLMKFLDEINEIHFLSAANQPAPQLHHTYPSHSPSSRVEHQPSPAPSDVPGHELAYLPTYCMSFRSISLLMLVSGPKDVSGMMKEGEWGVVVRVRVMILDAYITSCSALSSVPSEVFGLLSIYHVVSFFLLFLRTTSLCTWTKRGLRRSKRLEELHVS